MPRNDGGPAFPTPREDRSEELRWTDDGMSLRDWFAGQALKGILPARDEQGRTAYTEMTASEIAAAAWKQADAMLAGREEDRNA